MTKKTDATIFLIDDFKRSELNNKELLKSSSDLSKDFLNKNIIIHRNQSVMFHGFRLMNISNMTDLNIFLNAESRKLLAVGVSLN